MPVKLNTSDQKPQARFHSIKISDDTEFEIEIQPPTFQDLIADSDRPFGFLQERISRGVVGWRGVEDSEGKLIPFTDENLESLCVQYPAVLQMLSVTLGTYYLTGFRETPDDEFNDTDHNNDSKEE